MGEEEDRFDAGASPSIQSIFCPVQSFTDAFFSRRCSRPDQAPFLENFRKPGKLVALSLGERTPALPRQPFPQACCAVLVARRRSARGYGHTATLLQRKSD